MQTTIHAYCFDTRKPEEDAAYKALAARLTAQGLECFKTWGGGKGGHYFFAKPIDGRAVTLETAHLFDNQWNTAPIEGVSESGYRVFDWAEDYPIDFPAALKRGHYLEQTDEMRAARRDTLKCGYCGHQRPASSGLKFCPDCLGSAHLKEDRLHLTRLLPVAHDSRKRAELTGAERAELMPRYLHAQTVCNAERSRKRLEKLRADAIKDADKKIRTAAIERDGILFFLDNGLEPDNLIFYGHTGRFCLGWRSPLSQALAHEWTVKLRAAGFPYPLDFETVSGKIAFNE